MLSQMVGAEEQTVFPIDKALLATLQDGTTRFPFGFLQEVCSHLYFFFGLF